MAKFINIFGRGPETAQCTECGAKVVGLRGIVDHVCPDPDDDEKTPDSTGQRPSWNADPPMVEPGPIHQPPGEPGGKLSQSDDVELDGSQGAGKDAPPND